jgi:hypothetical protein
MTFLATLFGGAFFDSGGGFFFLNRGFSVIARGPASQVHIETSTVGSSKLNIDS